MTPTIIVDANVFLRYLLNDIKTQVLTAEKLFNKAKRKEVRLVVPQVVIFEIVFALNKYYNLEKDELIEKMDTVLSTSFLEIEERGLFVRSLELYQNKSISFVDSFLLAKAENEDAELFSFDKKLKRN